MSKAGMVVGAVGLVLLAVVLILQVVTMTAAPAATAGVTEPTGITVMAQGKAMGKPDVAMISIGVETRDAEAQSAVDENDEVMADVMAAILEAGVAQEDIQTVDYSVRAEIDWEDDDRRVIGYVVNNSVIAKLREVDKAGDVLDAATAAGANNIYGIQFTFDDPTALREEARAEAMAQARDKAEALAQLAGVGLGQPRYINESSMDTPPYYVEPIYAAAERGMGGGVTPVEPGQQQVTVQVQVTYEIR